MVGQFLNFSLIPAIEIIFFDPKFIKGVYDLRKISFFTCQVCVMTDLIYYNSKNLL